jgi:predicted nucleic acid-binding protein
LILPDTSAWVEFLRGTGSGTHLRVRELIRRGALIGVTEPVEMELLNGEHTAARVEAQRSFLRSFTWLPFVTATDFEAATTIFRTCRAQGGTPRGTVDCMIAAVALRHEATLLTADADLARIAQVMGIPLDPASVSP